MNTHYTLAPRHEGGEDLDEIIGLLNVYQTLSRPVDLMNYFRELPITSVSSLTRFDYGKYEIAVSELHLMVIMEQLETIVRLEGCTVLARCSDIQLQKRTLIIYGFRYIDLHAVRRQAFRLNLDAKLIVDFRNEQGKVAAQMVDISITGCRIRIKQDNVANGVFAVLEIQIFDQQQNKEMTRSIAARVVKTFYSEDVSYCCLEFIGPPSDQDLLARYLNQKQTSLIRDFRDKNVLLS